MTTKPSASYSAMPTSPRLSTYLSTPEQSKRKSASTNSSAPSDTENFCTAKVWFGLYIPDLNQTNRIPVVLTGLAFVVLPGLRGGHPVLTIPGPLYILFWTTSYKNLRYNLLQTRTGPVLQNSPYLPRLGRTLVPGQ